MSHFVPRKVIGKFMHVTDEPIKRSGGKSLVFFMGAGFCPFCAAERWAIIEALGRFGRWEGVVDDRSADHDEKFLNLPTVNLARAKYHSDNLEFVGRETSDRNFEALQELSESDYEILDKYDPDQIIPFLLIDGQYIQVGSGYSPQLLEGTDHAKVRAEIQSNSSPLGKAINSEADNIAALICKATRGGSPSPCQEKAVTDRLKQL